VNLEAQPPLVLRVTEPDQEQQHKDGNEDPDHG